MHQTLMQVRQKNLLKVCFFFMTMQIVTLDKSTYHHEATKCNFNVYNHSTDRIYIQVYCLHCTVGSQFIAPIRFYRTVWFTL